ncbi:hypothetical protein [Burkholderia humptydooensis]|uniref:hypothetical protein n=1 Tax=Burkholderia humptydooensis TaxID=430531 RepID=UPI0012FE01B0|nr:hypothetical protein [Burkholderia humptydooensis]
MKKPSTAARQRGGGEWLSCVAPAPPAVFVSVMSMALVATRRALDAASTPALPA